MRMRVCVLGGAPYAEELVAQLHSGGWAVTTVVPENVVVNVVHGEVVTGDFGGPAGLAMLLRSRRIEVFINAAHPFDVDSHCAAEEAARATRVPFVSFAPKPWDYPTIDIVGSAVEAAQTARRNGHYILVAASPRWVDMEAFSSDTENLYVFRAPHERLVRSIRLPARYRVLPGPMFNPDARHENDMLTGHQIDCVIVADTGAPAAQPLLDAASRRGIPIVMIKRPRVLSRDVLVMDSFEDIVNAI